MLKSSTFKVCRCCAFQNETHIVAICHISNIAPILAIAEINIILLSCNAYAAGLMQQGLCSRRNLNHTPQKIFLHRRTGRSVQITDDAFHR